MTLTATAGAAFLAGEAIATGAAWTGLTSTAWIGFIGAVWTGLTSAAWAGLIGAAVTTLTGAKGATIGLEGIDFADAAAILA